MVILIIYVQNKKLGILSKEIGFSAQNPISCATSLTGFPYIHLYLLNKIIIFAKTYKLLILTNNKKTIWEKIYFW